MPPEPLPWDRKDFFKERKHERPESVARWRESPSMSSYHHGSSREFTRWGSADFRRPPGHGKQGGWHQFAGDPGYGYGPLRSADKVLEAESCRPFFSRGDGKYFRNNVRENRGSYSQREWKGGHAWETGNGFPNTYGRPDDMNNEQRSVDDMLTYPSHSSSEFVNSCDQLHTKDQHDNKASGSNGLSTGLRSERENSVGSMDWKPLKWNRSGSLSSRGSGFSHSSSSKSLGGLDSTEGKAEFQQKNVTPVQSPSGDAAACVTSAAPSDETTSRKKPRLGWGEGLAKYEKKKVEGPDISANGGGTSVSISNQELNHSVASNLADKSPRVLALSDCASPATPSSVACSSSPGLEEKSFVKAANGDNYINELCGSPSLVSQNHLEGFTFNLEKLDVNSIANLGSSLNELLQPDDHCSVDSSFVHSTAMNKLLLWKGEILKAVEMTESEIDLLENELKSLKCESGESCPCPAISSSFLLEQNQKPCEKQDALSNLICRPTPLQIDQSGDAVLDTNPLCNGAVEVASADVKDEDIDSPGSATSKFTEPSSVGKAASPSHIINRGECSRDLDAFQSTTMEVCVASGCSDVGAGMPACKDGGLLPKIGHDAEISESVNCHGIGEKISYDVILSANKELAKRASEVFNKFLPKDHCSIDISGVVTGVASWHSDSFIREKFLVRKQDLRVKERILTLKYRAFHHLWKEDMHLLSVRKYRAKSQKKFEVTLRATHGAYQKHRSSVRSRFSLPAGNLSLVPTMEMINFASKLLSESQAKHQRCALKMPALILDEKEKQLSRFVSTNGLVEDPCAVEKERSFINPWTSEEKDIFTNKLATFGKDFRKISSFLDHKTTADCVEFYYKNHKSDCFEKTKKKQGKSATSTYMVTSGKKWSRERNAASLDILGAASVIAAQAESRNGNRQMSSGRIFLGGCSESKSSQVDDSIAERSSSFDFAGNDRETAAADVLAGICGSLSSEAMSSCITSSVDPGSSEWKCQKVDSVMKWTSTSDVTQNIDDDSCSDESCEELDPVDWTDEEKSIFVQAFSSYGKDFSMISRRVRTRSQDQCRVFFSKIRKRLGLDLINPRARNTGTSMSDDANGDGSDTEETCVLESSVVGDKQGSKGDEDLPLVTMNEVGSDPAGNVNLHTDLNNSENNEGMRILDHSNSEAVESVVSDISWLEVKPRPNCKSHDNNQLELEPAQESVALTDVETGKDQLTEQCTSIAVSTSVGEVVDACPCNINSETDRTSLARCSTKLFKNDLKVQEPLLAKSKLDDLDEKCGAKTISQGFSLSPKVLHPVSLELDSSGKPSVVLAQEGTYAASNSKSQDSDASKCNKMSNQDRMSSTHDFQDIGDKCSHKSVSGDEYTVSNHGESSQITVLPISTKKEINVDVRCIQDSEVQSLPKSDGDVGGRYLAQDCYLRKCNGSKSQSSVAAISFLAQNLEQPSDHPRAHSRSLSDTEKPCRNGNVKLFGQILNSSGDENGKGTNFLKQTAKSSNSKLNGHNQVDGSSAIFKFDRHNYLGLENVPMSFGFWDGSRIQTGFSSLPDSSILMAKYPAAFGNYPTASSKMGQQALPTAGKSNERNLNGVSVFPPMDISNNGGVMDYQMYRGRDGSKMQSFSLDMKPRQEMFSEMQRRNGADVIPSLQQQGRGMVGMDVVGRTGVLGGSTGVSDPVAALLHARTELYGGQNGSIVREEESWRGKGDIGR